MHDQRRPVLHLRELSSELVRSFLSIGRYQIALPKQIILYGCPMEPMLLIADAMGQELAALNDISISILSRSEASSVEGAYCIDVGYFVGPDFSPDTPLIEETERDSSKNGHSRNFDQHTGRGAIASALAAFFGEPTWSLLAQAVI